MTVESIIEGSKATIRMEGELNAMTASELQDEVNALPAEVVDIDIDLTLTDYISSAGIRVFVGTARMTTSRGGKFRLLHPQEKIYELFNMTGLTDAFTFVQ
ncbi:MAG: STAS domain-containing protein [Lachnospiraceae bacterium]|nr:STAS domain-containing protein [Lachnospiraceae bacterium]